MRYLHEAFRVNLQGSYALFLTIVNCHFALSNDVNYRITRPFFHASTPTPTSLLIRNRLQPQKLLNPPMTIEAAKPTRLGTTMRQRPLIMHSHRVDMYSTAEQSLASSASFIFELETYPLSICFAILRPLAKFSVKTAPERP